MSENTNDLYMQWNTTLGATHTSIFLAVGLAKGVISLVHFLSKLHQDHLLKGGEVENFASFLKVTKGDYNIERVPLTVNENAEEDIAKVKQAMDSAGIRYCMLPDFNGDGPEKSAYIAVYEKDQQKFAEVFMNHVKNELTGGSKNIDDLKNFTDGRTTVFSIPDETTGPMEEAMAKFKINFSMITADVTPHHTQYLIPNSQLSRLQFIYKTFQEDMKKDGRTVDDSEVIATPEAYADKAKMSNEDYIRKQMEDPQVAKAMDVKEGEEMDPELFEVLNKAGDSESLACGQYFKNENYMPISIDDQTLVHNPKDRMVFDIQMKNPGVFACRIPGTYGENEQVLLLPTEQVFKVEDAKRPRYIAFLRTDTKPAVISAGKDNVIGSPYEDAKALYQHFDREGKKLSYNPEHLETISAEEMKEGWEGIEPAAAEKKPPAGMSQATYDKIHSFPEHDYDFAAIEKRMLEKSRGGGKAAEAAAAAVKSDAADVAEGAAEVAKTIANSIPTKTLSL